MSATEFHIDKESYEEAERLTTDLRKSHTIIAGERGPEILRTLGGDPWELSRVIDDLARPLDDFVSEIPFRDIGTDVREFGIVAALARGSDRPMTALLMGSQGKPVPVLPAHGVLGILLRVGDPLRRTELARVFLEVVPPTMQVIRLRVAEAEDAFFHGLSSYLAARIAGVRWFRLRMTQQPPAGGGSGPPGGPGGGGATGQWWIAKTNASGLSMYYAGTHAVRNPPNYLAGLTTPLPIHLPMGTLYLGADAGPGGSVVWDPNVVTVPSHSPTFNTRAF
jgi:hypothetical protein